MPLPLPEHALVTLLRQCFISPHCQASRTRSVRLLNSSAPLRHRHRHRHVSILQRPRRAYHTSSPYPEDPRPGSILSINNDVHDSSSTALFAGHADGDSARKQTRIAVIGGGVTGLTAAHYITREMPHAKVTIYEAGSRVGGWLQSETVKVEGGQVLLEKGPRTLRPHTDAALVTLDMIQELGLQDEMLVSWNNSPAARNRFVYYPDHLVKMPGPGQSISDMLWTIITEPAFKGLWSSLFERGNPPRPSNIEDESVLSFLTRRAGSPHIANNLVSAVFHGIYAGDIEKLSAKSLLPKQYHMEKVSGNFSDAFMDARRNQYVWALTKDHELRTELGPRVEELTDDLRGASVFSFKKGIGALTDALEASLRRNPNVQFRTNDPIKSLKYDVESNSIQITSATTQLHTRAISTISSSSLASLAGSPTQLPSLTQTPSVTVMVVNLYYTTPLLLPEQGFGYLIPRSIPYAQNPECALGVVFDSDAITGQDSAPGTKVTVMMGGHWWSSFTSLPSKEEGEEMAKSVLKRHLKIDEQPAVVRTSIQRDCIPQYTVGHESRMRDAHEEIKDVFKGKLAVAGNAYTGVGMNDCVRAARDVVLRIKAGEGVTGLEEFSRESEGGRWMKVRAKRAEEVVKDIRAKVQRKVERDMKRMEGKGMDSKPMVRLKEIK